MSMVYIPGDTVLCTATQDQPVVLELGGVEHTFIHGSLFHITSDEDARVFTHDSVRKNFRLYGHCS